MHVYPPSYTGYSIAATNAGRAAPSTANIPAFNLSSPGCSDGSADVPTQEDDPVQILSVLLQPSMPLCTPRQAVCSCCSFCCARDEARTGPVHERSPLYATRLSFHAPG